MNSTRKFLSVVIASGLDFGILSPDDLTRHITMEVLAHHLPVALKSNLLAASLKAKTMDSALILDTLGVDALAEHVPSHLLWNCISESGINCLGETTDAEPIDSSKKEKSVDSSVKKSSSKRTRIRPRKPNHLARASRIRASTQAPDPSRILGGSVVFDGDTTVGEVDKAESSEQDIGYPGDEVTVFGHEIITK